ncbi:MAG: hypothetical protein WAM28_01695, partial [Chlamydiales bacterium]
MSNYILTNSSSSFSQKINSQPIEIEKKPEAAKYVLDRLSRGNLSKNKQQLIKNFSQITSEELKGVLNSYFEELMTDIEGEDPIKIAEQLAQIIPFERL